jgi:hypothetical protein
LLENGDPDSGGGAAYSGLAPWLPVPGDPRKTSVVLDERFAALESTLRDEIAEGGIRPRSTRVDHLIHEHALTRQMAGSLVPVELERSQSANLIKAVDGIFGDGSNNHPDFIDTDLTINEDGSLEP